MSSTGFFLKNRLILLSIASGLLLAVSWPARGIPVIAFIALIPLFFVEQELFANRERNRGISLFLYAWLSFFIWNLLTTWWIVFSTVPGMITAVVLNSLFMAVPWWLMHCWRRLAPMQQGPFPIILFWLSFEYLHTKWELSWNWLDLGNVFAPWPKWVQWYEFTGTAGGAIWILVVNLLLFYFIKEVLVAGHFNRKSRWFAAISAGMFLFPLLISLFMFSRYQEKPNPVEVVIVQPSEDPYQEPRSLAEAIGRTEKMIALAHSKITDSTMFVVAPEAVMPEGIWKHQADFNRHVLMIRDHLSRNPQLRWVIGSLVYQLYEPGSQIPHTARKLERYGLYFDTYNSAVMIGHYGPLEFYHKSMLVPGVERMPFFRLLRPVGKLVESLGGTAGSLGTQDYREVFKTGQFQPVIAPVICYESIYGDFMSGFIRNGATMIFILTEDGWWRRTPGHRQHHEYARLRAIEFRRPIVRAAGTGISSFIDQKGNVLQKAGWWETTAMRQSINQNDQMTYFARHGNVAGRFLVFLSLLLLLAMLSRVIIKHRKPS
ncbi:MAG TPA: apolipoprotein N-acyltransferase [Bacteroidales bacterium]|nr:apolipoprotein N-acyltransferase [Bacteroidales bacterium]